MKTAKKDTIVVHERDYDESEDVETVEKNTKEEEYLSQLFHDPPAYTPKKPQTFPIVNKTLGGNLTLFPSHESEVQFNEGLTSEGYGMPLFTTHTYYFSSKFMSFKKFFVPNDGSFEKETHFEEYCLVKRTIGLRCSVYTLEFLDKKIMMFYHKILPIVDYRYQGNIYRWVREKKYKTEKYLFTLLQLGPERGYSMVDSWDETTSTLLKNHPMTRLENVFSLDARKPKPEMYEDSIAIGELRENSKLGNHRTQISLENTHSSDYDNINSIDEDMLVHLIAGMVIKRQVTIFQKAG